MKEVFLDLEAVGFTEGDKPEGFTEGDMFGGLNAEDTFGGEQRIGAIFNSSLPDLALFSFLPCLFVCLGVVEIAFGRIVILDLAGGVLGEGTLGIVDTKPLRR